MGSFSLYQWAVVGVIVFVLFKIFKSEPSASKRAASGAAPTYHCMTCGADGEGATRTRGSIGIEVVLWLCFLVPGLIYSLWRLSSRRQVCATCGSESIVPYSAPAALSHRQQIQSTAPRPS